MASHTVAPSSWKVRLFWQIRSKEWHVHKSKSNRGVSKNREQKREEICPRDGHKDPECWIRFSFYDVKEQLLSRVCFSVAAAALCSRIQPRERPAPRCPDAEAAPFVPASLLITAQVSTALLASQPECWTPLTFHRTFTHTLTDLLNVIHYLRPKNVLFCPEYAPKRKQYAFEYTV